MIKNDLKYGFSQTDWDKAKEEAKQAMVRSAKLRGMLTYSKLVSQINSINLEPRDPRLFHLLGEISSEEDKGGAWHAYRCSGS